MGCGERSGLYRNGHYFLQVAADEHKDQTYFLWMLTEEQLRRTIFPLGDLTKDQVRDIARQHGYESLAQKRESQEICFIPDNDHAGFIEREAGADVPPPGNFVSKDGKILGEHKGITHYTIGQRRGLGLAMGHYVYVTGIRTDTNEVVIGEDEDVYSSKLSCHDINFMGLSGDEPDPGDGRRLFGKIRYRHPGEWCTVKRTGKDSLDVFFEKPVRAVTPGQAVVLYDDDHVACGGTID